jgi:hypothetical protein
MTWSTEITDCSGNRVIVPSGLLLSPATFSRAAMGGPLAAAIPVSGPTNAVWQILGWLRYGVDIYSPQNDWVWWGIVSQVDITIGAIAVSLSLDDVVNSVSVVFSDAGVSYQTDFLTDTDSISRYGERQLVLSLDEMPQAVAEAKQALALAARKYPVPQLVPGQWTEFSASLTCSGLWSSLNNKYHTRSDGYEAYTSGGASQRLGVGFVSDGVSFEASTRFVSDINGNLTGLIRGDRIRWVGATSNAGVYTVEEGTERGTASFTSAGIGFNHEFREIRDSNNSLADVQAHDLIHVSGSVNNDGYYWVDQAFSDGSKIVVLQELVEEPGPLTVTVTRGHSIKVEQAITNELPGASVTVTLAGAHLIQLITPSSADAWTVNKILLSLARIGGAFDPVRLSIYTDSGGNPDTLLETTTIAGDTIGAEQGWMAFTFANTTTLTPGSYYWLKLERTGSNSTSNYYVVGVGEDLGYTAGPLYLYEGSDYIARDPNADLLFEIRGAVATTTQIKAAIDNHADLLSTAEIMSASGIETWQYRDGQNTVLDDVLQLANVGDTAGRRILPIVRANKTVAIQPEPSKPLASAINYFIGVDGQVTRGVGLPMPPGDLSFVGQWASYRDVIPTIANLSGIGSISPVFIESAQFDTRTMRHTITLKDARTPWEIGLIREG